LADESWVPRFEYVDDHWVVHFGGRQWWLMTVPRIDPRVSTYTTRSGEVRGSIWDRATLSFDVRLIPPPPDLSIPDNIVLGEN